MVSTRRTKALKSSQSATQTETHRAAVNPKRRRVRCSKEKENEKPEKQTELKREAGLDYEKFREERIKANMERMQKLGIISLSQKLKTTSTAVMATSNPKSRASAAWSVKRDGNQIKQQLCVPRRRSTRLQNVAPVSYAELHPKKGDPEKSEKNGSICLNEGEKEEIYTEEHEKLLGTCESPWTLFVDGYSEDGKRIYDQTNGKTCHQCRQKTLGHHTSCSTCNLVQGQFCGDCLYIRYGENVLEAKKNPNWTCPVCRGICNCSVCRVKKGWAPTGTLYRRVQELGFKSVAHYLIQTYRSHENSSNQNAQEEVSVYTNPADR